MNIDLTAHQFRRAADLKEQIDALESQLSVLLGGAAEPTLRRRHGMSTAGRARIAAAARARWARVRAAGGNGAVTRKPRRRMSAAVKAHLAAVARARWRKAKAAGKHRL